jgi:dUTP pyrophosphatase
VYSSHTGITKGIACFDFFCRETVTIEPKEIKLVPSNSIIKMPEGYTLLIASRSNLPIRRGLTIANSPGVLDPYFCGDDDEIMLQVYNMTDKPVTVERGTLVAQGLILKYETAEWEEVDSMNEKGDGGYWAVRRNVLSKKTETS